jgi:hypothetical protein
MNYIYHHLGLGDHIICNGMVRYFHKENGALKLFCYEHNYKNVAYMYRDLENFELISVKDENEADSIIKNLDSSIKVIKIGFNKLSEFTDRVFDEAFYAIAGLDFSVKMNNFYFERELEVEKEILFKMNPTGEKYVFIHDDIHRGFKIDESRILSPYKKIYNDNSIPLFHCISLIENAEEVHVMQSSIKDLINSFKFPKPKFFLHEYVRGLPSSLFDTKGYNKFKIFKKIEIKEIETKEIETKEIETKKIGINIEDIIKDTVKNLLNKNKNVELTNDLIETDNIGEVIEKLAILHCRMWYLEDAISDSKNDNEIAQLKLKIDICFKQKRPKYVEAINRMIENSILNEKSLIEDSVKLYKVFTKF